MKTVNLMIVGVGGQGSLLASKLLGHLLLSRGYDVKVSEVHGMRAWSDSVGEPKGCMPIATQRCTSGCETSMRDERRRNERGLTSERRFSHSMPYISSFVYNSFERTSTTMRHSSGMTLCCVPALTTVSVMRVAPRKGDTFAKLWRLIHCMSSSAS